MKRSSWLIAAVCGLIITGLGLLWQGVGSAETAADRFRIFSNATLLAGVILTGIGALAWVSDEHFFDGIRYSVSSLFARLSGKPKRYATYYDFIHRGKKKGSGFAMLLPGLIFLGLAVILTGLFYLVR
ncbi:MAG: DUF3899 domain-containing protein [Lachnospiraceae bacterium]|nr:DUF3899 domain-containing protein [Ruminococcus sp.]MCM1274062.1 DUF3899 domain-containing protein [Lachnospiraceae bacterium]